MSFLVKPVTDLTLNVLEKVATENKMGCAIGMSIGLCIGMCDGFSLIRPNLDPEAKKLDTMVSVFMPITIGFTFGLFPYIGVPATAVILYKNYKNNQDPQNK